MVETQDAHEAIKELLEYSQFSNDDKCITFLVGINKQQADKKQHLVIETKSHRESLEDIG